MPAPLDNGQPGRRALDSQEAGLWLRSFLKCDVESTDRRVSSHSLKSTMLSFLAKRGIEMSDRLLLGYHTSPFTMGLTYSRDGMARPLQILSDMLSEIRCGNFLPDQTGVVVSFQQNLQAEVQIASRNWKVQSRSRAAKMRMSSMPGT